jgi:DNA (cytosine-5)-methyltransferase 1
MLSTKDRLGLVTIHGEDYQIVDIGMRMLTPRELFRAQGFPDSYIIDPIFDGKPLTKTAQVRMCGNSVCPPVAAAIIRAQFGIKALEKAA